MSHFADAKATVIGVPLRGAGWEQQHEATLRAALIRDTALPTAFVCDADFRAARVLAVLQSFGVRCPDECSVIGVWNTPWSQITTPMLTTVSFVEEEIARLLLLLAEHPISDTPTQIAITPRLIERGSTGVVSNNQ